MPRFTHHYDKDGSCSFMGHKAELEFAGACRKMGLLPYDTDLNGQLSHKDFTLLGGLSVDVKSAKRIRRRDARPQYEMAWVEIHGPKKKGWLFGGKANWIAFERRYDFVCVPRQDLASFVEAHVQHDMKAESPDTAVYRPYLRGKSLLSLIPMRDITKNLPVLILKK